MVVVMVLVVMSSEAFTFGGDGGRWRCWGGGPGEEDRGGYVFCAVATAAAGTEVEFLLLLGWYSVLVIAFNRGFGEPLPVTSEAAHVAATKTGNEHSLHNFPTNYTGNADGE